MFATANGMNFEIPSEMKPVTAQSCGNGKKNTTVHFEWYYFYCKLHSKM